MAEAFTCARCDKFVETGRWHECEPRDPLLVEREKTHGSFADNAELWEALCQTGKFQRLSSAQKLALDMIYVKIARIASNPNVKDHWDDIAGYAKLGAEACSD